MVARFCICWDGKKRGKCNSVPDAPPLLQFLIFFHSDARNYSLLWKRRKYSLETIFHWNWRVKTGIPGFMGRGTSKCLEISTAFQEQLSLLLFSKLSQKGSAWDIFFSSSFLIGKALDQWILADSLNTTCHSQSDNANHIISLKYSYLPYLLFTLRSRARMCRDVLQTEDHPHFVFLLPSRD